MTESSDPNDPVQIVNAIYEAVIAGDMDACLKHIDVDIVASPPPYFPWGGPHHGRAAWMTNAVPKLATAHDLTRVRLESVQRLGDSDKCIALLHLPLADSTDEAYLAEIWTIRNSKAVALEVFCWDWRPVQNHIDRQQLQLSPSSP